MGSRLAVLIILLILSGIVYFFNPTFFPELFQVLQSGDAETVAAFIRSFGIWAVLASVLISTLMTFGLVIPFIILSGANGIVFGLGWGTVVSWAGEVIGAMIAFGLYRIYFRPAITSRFCHTPHWSYVEKFSGERGFETVLIARILPVIPSGILTTIAAISNITLRDFWWATVLGKIPSVFVKTMVGHDMMAFQENKVRLVIGIISIGILYGLAWWVRRKGTRG